MARNRSDWIAAGALLVAAFAVAFPLVREAWDNSQKPSVTIDAPSPRKTIKSPFGANGTWSHVSASDDLWLIVRSGIEGRWYPVGRLPKLPDHTWKTAGNAIQPALGAQQIEIFRVPETADATLINYINGRADPGLSGLPAEAERLAGEDLTVAP